MVNKTSEEKKVLEEVNEQENMKSNEKVEAHDKAYEGTISEEDKDSTPKEKNEPNTERGKQTVSTKKRMSRLVTSKVPLTITQPIVYRPSTRCSSVTMTPNPEEQHSTDKLFPPNTANERGTCTEFSLNSLERLHVSSVNIDHPIRTKKKRVKSFAKENFQDNIMIKEESYKIIMKESIRRRGESSTPSISLSKFKQTFNERLNAVNNALSQRYMSEIEFHKNALRKIPETISTPRVRLLNYWAKDLVNKQEEAFYQP